MIDPDGFLTEGTGSNFFIIKNNRIYTPEPRNLLRGISRDYVFELAEELGITVIEKNLEPYDLMAADEAFFSCTPFCIVPAVRFHGREIGAGKVGPIYTKLINSWSQKVGVDIIAQAQAYAATSTLGLAPGPTPYQFAEPEKKSSATS